MSTPARPLVPPSAPPREDARAQLPLLQPQAAGEKRRVVHPPIADASLAPASGC